MNALTKPLLQWEPDAKARGKQRVTDQFLAAKSSEPGADGSALYPQPDSGSGPDPSKSAVDQYAGYNASIPTQTPQEYVAKVIADAKAEGRTQANLTDILKMAPALPEAMVQGLIEAAISGATAPGDAMAGKLTDPTGETLLGKEGVERGTALAGLMSSGTLAGAPMEDALGSGAMRRPTKAVPDVTVAPTGRTWGNGARAGQAVYKVQKGAEIREIAATSPEEAQSIFERLYNTPNEEGGYGRAGDAGPPSPIDPVLEAERKKADALYANGDLTDAQYDTLLAKVEKGGKVNQAKVDKSNAKAQASLDEQFAKDPDFLNKQVEALRKAVANSAADNPDYVSPKPKDLTLNAGSKAAPLLEAGIGAAKDAPAWFSHAQRVVESLPTKSAPANQWLATLKNKGVKQEELDTLNLPSGDQAVSKEDLLKTIKTNTPQLNEVVKGGKGGTGNWATDMAELENQVYAEHPDWPDSEREIEIERRMAGGEAPATKYSQYQLPGGENYREVLVTTPSKGDAPMRTHYELYRNGENIAVGDETAAARWAQQYPNDEIRQTTIPDTRVGHGNPENYRSSHWDEPNVLGHYRVNDRHIAEDGFSVYNRASGNKSPVFKTREEAEAYKANLPPTLQANTHVIGDSKPVRTLHAEEFQSDWHQQGKKQGYKPSEGKLPSNYSVAKFNDNGYVVKDGEGGQVTAVYETPQEAIDAVLKHPGSFSGVPDAPFKKSWPDLLLKKFARRAVDEGYDAISWTDGKTQAERYDLSKQIDKVSYHPTSKRLVAAKGRNVVIDKEGVAPEQLPDLIGKEAADKLLNNPTQKISLGGTENYVHQLEGTDLQVGGEGMKAFYDQELPRRAKKVLGAEVEKKPIVTGKPLSHWTFQYLKDSGNNVKKAIARLKGDIREAGDEIADFPEFSVALSELEGLQKSNGLGKADSTINFVRLTPGIKDRISKGFPLFSGGVPVPGEPPNVDRTHDVPAFAGSSNDDGTVYIDKKVPHTLVIDGKPIDPAKYLAIHEQTEHELMTGQGLSYEDAHKQATAAEKAQVEADGIDWKSYEAHINGMLHTIENEPIKDPPVDLYNAPYHSPGWGKTAARLEDAESHRRHVDSRGGVRFTRVNHNPFKEGVK